VAGDRLRESVTRDLLCGCQEQFGRDADFPALRGQQGTAGGPQSLTRPGERQVMSCARIVGASVRGRRGNA